MTALRKKKSGGWEKRLLEELGGGPIVRISGGPREVHNRKEPQESNPNNSLNRGGTSSSGSVEILVVSR